MALNSVLKALSSTPRIIAHDLAAARNFSATADKISKVLYGKEMTCVNVNQPCHGTCQQGLLHNMRMIHLCRSASSVSELWARGWLTLL